MGIPSGMSAQLGIATESTYGEYQTVTRFLPLVSESLTREVERMQSEGIIAGARLIRSGQWAPGNVTVAGEVGAEWYQQGLGIWLHHMLGSVTSSATGGIATHTFTPGALTDLGASVQVGRPDVNGAVYPFTYTGVKVSEFTWELEAGRFATFGASLIGQLESITRSLEVATYVADADKPFSFVQGAVSISGSSVCTRKVTITGNNQLSDDRRCVGQAHIDQPLERALREYGGTATIEFNTTAQYERFLAGGEYPMVLSMSAANNAQVTITMNTRWDGKTPVVEGRDLLVVEYPFVCVGTTAGGDAAGLQVVMVNSQTTP